MHVEFIARGRLGQGGGRLPAREARRGRQAARRRRGPPRRFRETVVAVADALEFEHKYTSGVMAWAPEDRPTDAQIEAMLDMFRERA